MDLSKLLAIATLALVLLLVFLILIFNCWVRKALQTYHAELETLGGPLVFEGDQLLQYKFSYKGTTYNWRRKTFQ